MSLRAMDATKPYKFIGFGAMDITKPYKFIGFGAPHLCSKMLGSNPPTAGATFRRERGLWGRTALGPGGPMNL